MPAMMMHRTASVILPTTFYGIHGRWAQVSNWFTLLHVFVVVGTGAKPWGQAVGLDGSRE